MVHYGADLAETFGALADETRIGIVTQLSRGPASVSELAQPFDMTLRGVLKHIQVLEDAGVVHTTKQGRTRFCELDPSWLAGTTAWVNRVQSMWNKRLGRMADYLKEEK